MKPLLLTAVVAAGLGGVLGYVLGKYSPERSYLECVTNRTPSDAGVGKQMAVHEYCAKKFPESPQE